MDEQAQRGGETCWKVDGEYCLLRPSPFGGGVAGRGPYIHIIYIYLRYTYSIFTSLQGGLGVRCIAADTLAVLKAIGHLFGAEVVM